MERRFRRDFSGVRVHAGQAAEQSARDIAAHAYTLGEHIVFGDSRYAPRTSEGRRLIAHELAHVVQQLGNRPTGSGNQRVSRWGFSFPEPPRFPDVSDANIKWIADLPEGLRAQIDLGFKETIEARSVAKIESTVAGKIKQLERQKPGAERDAAIAALRAAAVSDVQAETQRFAAGRDDHRKEFLHKMRILLGPDPAAEHHFKAFEEVEGSPGLFLHKDAANRMKAVRADLKRLNAHFDLPLTKVGQALRGRHIGKMQTHGMLGHPLGLSVDYQAAANPKITAEVEKQGPERLALLQLMSGGPTRFELSAPGNDRRAFIEAMGKRTAAGQDVEQEANVKTFFTTLEEQFTLTAAASDRFKQSLPEANLARLRELKAQYEPVAVALDPIDAKLLKLDKKITGEQAKARRVIARRDSINAVDVAAADVDADAKVLALLNERKPLADEKARLEVKKDEIRAQLKPVFQPWLDKIQEKVDALRTAGAKEVIALDQIPTAKELTKMVEKLEKIDALEKRLLEHPTAKSAATWTRQIRKGQAGIAAELARLDSLLGTAPRTVDGNPLPASTRLEQAQTLLLTRELHILMSLSRQLSDNTQFVFGDLDDKKRQLALESGDPSVAQLIGALDLPGRKTDEGGFFNPDPEEVRRGFNFRFIKTMVKHGFDPGAAWLPGSTDPMHFDFIEGWAKFVN